MAVAVISRYPDLDPQTYDRVIAALELDVNPPAGAVLHVAGEAEGGIVVSEIWQTEQTFRAFLEYRLRPALRMQGAHGDPIVEVAPSAQRLRGRDVNDRAAGRGIAPGALRRCGALLSAAPSPRSAVQPPSAASRRC